MRTACVVAVAGLWACGGDDGGSGGGGGSPQGSSTPTDEPAPYIAPEGDPPDPAEDAAQIEEEAQLALDAVRTYSARPVRTAYDTAMTGSSGACPSFYTGYGGSYWYDACTSDLGTDFSGYAFAYWMDDYADPYYPGVTYSYWVVYGGATIEDESGQSLEVSGTAYYLDGATSDGTLLYQNQVQGTFSGSGYAVDTSWLAGSGMDPDIYLYAWDVPAVPMARYLYADGGFSGFGGDPGWAASFEDLEVWGAFSGAACTDEPGGAMAVRSSDGSWYDILFDGQTSYGPAPDPAKCDGCGEVFFEGTSVGQACLDTSAALSWGATPW